MELRVEMIAVGDELLNGTIDDTNASWLGDRLRRLGVTVARRQVVPDRVDAIAASLRLATGDADLVVVCGGLGPTVDDRTAEAAAAFAGRPVVLHEEALAQIDARFAAAGRTRRPLDVKQARLPEGAEVLENPVGTAPAFRLRLPEREPGRDPAPPRTEVIFLPGVPSEFRTLAERYVLPGLQARLERVPCEATWKFFGLRESDLAAVVDSLDTEGLEIHYRAHFPEIHLRAEADTPVALDRLGRAVLERCADQWFGGEEARFAATVNEALRQRGWTMAAAESCTGGQIAAMVTEEPGASDVFLLSVVSYANSAKRDLLGVPEALLSEHGAVSRPVVEAMARGARERSGATLGLAVSGIAGPGGGSAEKPVGTVHFALATEKGVTHRHHRFPWDRARTRTVAAYVGLAMVRQACAGTIG